VDELKSRPGVKQANPEANKLRVVMDRREAETTKQWLATSGLAITSLNTEENSLEDVFVYYTGRRLQEGENITKQKNGQA